MTMSFAGKTAIAGLGATEFSKNSGRSTLRLAVECSEKAIRVECRMGLGTAGSRRSPARPASSPTPVGAASISSMSHTLFSGVTSTCSWFVAG